MENVGELDAGLVAKRMGLKQVDNYVKSGVHGIDAIFKKGNKFFVVEAKGGVSGLGFSKTLDAEQMSRKWIDDAIAKMNGPLKDQLEKAVNKGNLFGLVTETPIDGATGLVLDPTYTIKHLDEIGSTLF